MTSKNSNILISAVYKSRRTVLDLMEAQGFNINDYNNFGISEVNSMEQNNQLDMLVDNGTNKTYIRYFLNKKISVTNINDMIEDLYVVTETLRKEDTLFIIVREDINDTVTTELVHIWETEGIYIVIENIKRLQFNILEHSLVPKHRVMTEEEVQEKIKKYNLTSRTQFPEISRFDPVAKAICLRPGHVCHILRPSKTAITADYFRLCV
jgi:DNA-directed RNA polymerase subunit H (RpoH/RPB5)